MLDFTSALYLGMTHPSGRLAPWRTLTLGRPAALEEPPGARSLAAELARLTGVGAGVLFPSTLHLFRDLFAAVAGRGSTLLLDAGAYPIARWATEQVRLQGCLLETYPHHDAAACARLARRAHRAGLRPIVVTDGLCPGCGRLAPLPELARAVSDHGGRLVVDDTQALGIVGAPAGAAAPLGLGGGGTLTWHGLSGPHVLAGASLAKGFGAPLAVLLGDGETVRSIARDGESRQHCSPPSAAVIAAARQALAINRTMGDSLRARLLSRVEQFRRGLARIGGRALSFLPLPVQSIAIASVEAARDALALLQGHAVHALVTKGCRGGVSLTFIMTARHAATDIDRLIDILGTARLGALRAPRMALEAT